MKERDLAQKRASETENVEDWEQYRRMRNTINNTIRKEKKEWKEAKLKSCGDDTGTVWKNIKTWLGWSSGGPPSKLVENGSIFTKPKDLAKIMNNYFVSKVKNLRENLPPNQGDPLSLLRRIMANRKCSFKLKCVHPDTVSKIISKMRSSSSCGLDHLNSRIIKLARPHLVPVITHLINLSISSQRFPESWKVSKVVPLHKKGEAIFPKHYRPVVSFQF